MPDNPAYPCQYEIIMDGVLRGETLSDDPDLLVSHPQSTLTGQPVTCLVLQVPDQAWLRGFLNHLWDLNLSLHSVRRLP